MPTGRKDIEIYEQSKQLSIEFIDNLEKIGCLKKSITPEEDALIGTVQARTCFEVMFVQFFQD